MPKRTTTKVPQNSTDQVTSPKAMGDALELAGEEVELDIVSSSKRSLEKTDEWGRGVSPPVTGE